MKDESVLSSFILPPSSLLLAERVGFEPTERFPVHSISSAASSTTPAPLHIANCRFPIANLFLTRVGTRARRTRITARDSTAPISNRQSKIGNVFWRRGWDSNPRRPLSLSGFRDRCTNPLCDLSGLEQSQISNLRSEISDFRSQTSAFAEELLHELATLWLQNTFYYLNPMI